MYVCILVYSCVWLLIGVHVCVRMRMCLFVLFVLDCVECVWLFVYVCVCLCMRVLLRMVVCAFCVFCDFVYYSGGTLVYVCAWSCVLGHVCV